jgi:hypothetical protein
VFLGYARSRARGAEEMVTVRNETPVDVRARKALLDVA